MERFEVVNGVLNLFNDPNYLEIGVDQGTTFAQVVASRKVAVDVRFAFDYQAAASNGEDNTVYVETTSDEYFLRHRGDDRFDVIFIDGLHTFEQTLRDLINSWSSLRDGGVIIVDDVMPTTYAASLPDLGFARTFWAATNNPDGSWMGDVYRLVFFIESFMPAFSYAMVAENHGQLIMWLDPRPPVADRTVRQIAGMDYADAVLNAGTFRPMPFGEIRASLEAWRSSLPQG